MCSGISVKKECIRCLFNQSIPFVSMFLQAGGRSRSLYSVRASRSARDTSSDVVVVQSTSNGYNPSNLFHANESTANEMERKLGKY